MSDEVRQVPLVCKNPPCLSSNISEPKVYFADVPTWSKPGSIPVQDEVIEYECRDCGHFSQVRRRMS